MIKTLNPEASARPAARCGEPSASILNYLFPRIRNIKKRLRSAAAAFNFFLVNFSRRARPARAPVTKRIFVCQPSTFL
jgi:hypothetical protein